MTIKIYLQHELQFLLNALSSLSLFCHKGTRWNLWGKHLNKGHVSRNSTNSFILCLVGTRDILRLLHVSVQQHSFHSCWPAFTLEWLRNWRMDPKQVAVLAWCVVVVPLFCSLELHLKKGPTVSITCHYDLKEPDTSKRWGLLHYPAISWGLWCPVRYRAIGSSLETRKIPSLC